MEGEIPTDARRDNTEVKCRVELLHEFLHACQKLFTERKFGANNQHLSGVHPIKNSQKLSVK